MSRVRVLNGTFDFLTLEETVQRVFAMIAGGNRGYLSTVNVAILMMMQDDARLQRHVDRSAITVADGIPIVWASRLRGKALPERVAGIDLVERICQRASQTGHSVYVLGATTDVLDNALRALRHRHPALVVAGSADGYFSADEAYERATAVRKSGARILFVGMGVPLQERFLEDHWDSLGVSFAMGVGGSLDVLSGRRVRAPKALQVAGLEWAFRLAQEPQRLFKRYLVTNTRFLYQLARESLTA